MTICVAAIGVNGLIVAACDRMKTGGDIEFEPRKDENDQLLWGGGSKILPLTSSIVALTAGDSALQVEILHRVFLTVTKRIKEQPNDWWRVEDVVNLYVLNHDKIKKERASSALLSPFGLDSESFLDQQSSMAPDVVANLTREIQTFDMPAVQTIFAGVDIAGDVVVSHIFVTSNCNTENICRSSCSDTTGFAAIGSGARHALSQFMLVGYHRRVETSETLFQTYLAKKRAEIAPGVGKATDIVTIGPQLGVSGVMKPEIVKKLDGIYQRYNRAEISLRKKGSDSAATFERTILSTQPKEQSAEMEKTNPVVEAIPPNPTHDPQAQAPLPE